MLERFATMVIQRCMYVTFTHRMGRKFRLSTHRKNEERLLQRKKASLLVSIPLDGLSLPECRDTIDGK